MEVPFDLMLQPQRKKFAENSWWGAQAKAPGRRLPQAKATRWGPKAGVVRERPPVARGGIGTAATCDRPLASKLKRGSPREGGDFRTRRGGSVLPGLALSARREMSSLDWAVGGRGKQDCHQSAFSQGEPLARAAISHESKEFRSVRGLEGSVNERQAAETATSGSPVRGLTLRICPTSGMDLPPVK